MPGILREGMNIAHALIVHLVSLIAHYRFLVYVKCAHERLVRTKIQLSR